MLVININITLINHIHIDSKYNEFYTLMIEEGIPSIILYIDNFIFI